MITLDSEEITVTYPDLYFLLRDIQVREQDKLTIKLTNRLIYIQTDRRTKKQIDELD